MSSFLTRHNFSLVTHSSHIVSNARKIIHRNELMFNCGELNIIITASKLISQRRLCTWVHVCGCITVILILCICEFLILKPIYCDPSVILHYKY